MYIYLYRFERYKIATERYRQTETETVRICMSAMKREYEPIKAFYRTYRIMPHRIAASTRHSKPLKKGSQINGLFVRVNNNKNTSLFAFHF